MTKKTVYAFKDSTGTELHYEDRRTAERLANGAEVYTVEVEEQTQREMLDELLNTASEKELAAIAANVAPKSWGVKAPADRAMTVREILKAADMTQKELSERFQIPRRTVEDWSRGARTCPPYVRRMMQELLGLE